MALEDLQHNFLTGPLEDIVRWAAHQPTDVSPYTFKSLSSLIATFLCP